jgi:hypothetical protein
MTTPTDEIAGLSERLKGRLGPSRTVTVGPGLYEDVSGAATAIDALQARVKELEDGRNFWKSERDRIKAFLSEGDWQTVESEQAWRNRALRAEQERDEAVTTTRYNIFDNLLGAYIGAGNEHLRIAIGNFAFMIFPEYRDALRRTAEECRLSAGPEKEGK